MEKKELEIRKAPEELTAEDLANVNGGSAPAVEECSEYCSDCPKDCSCD